MYCLLFVLDESMPRVREMKGVGGVCIRLARGGVGVEE